jgi:hypothetical protein
LADPEKWQATLPVKKIELKTADTGDGSTTKHTLVLEDKATGTKVTITRDDGFKGFRVNQGIRVSVVNTQKTLDVEEPDGE